MKSFLFVLCLALYQKFVNAVIEYRLDTPLYLDEARIKLSNFHILQNWIDFTLEYNTTNVASASWFAFGFGKEMNCSYALTFEPQLDSTGTTITDVIISERRLGDHQPGIKLQRRLGFIETEIIVAPQVKILSRIIRQRIVPVNYFIAQNATERCPENPYGYRQFAFDGADIDIIYARGVDGDYNVSYHTPPNRNVGTISLVAVDTLSQLNTSGLVNVSSFSTLMPITCPPRYSLTNYSFAERFSWPLVPRLCGSCDENDTNFNVTLLPITTQLGEGPNTFGNGDIFNSTQEYECTIMSNGSLPESVCGCTSVEWNNTEILFLVDGAGLQNDTDWREFTWKILAGYYTNVMLNANLSTNVNATMNDTLNAMNVNVIIYGGLTYQMQVRKLDREFLLSNQVSPISEDERHIANMCNATKFATEYLQNSDAKTKILITIPSQSPSDELECLVCGNCSLAGINTFTTKVKGDVDLSVLEMTFGSYDDCSYLYDNQDAFRESELQEWPYLLAAISDFICYTTENPITAGKNFSMAILMTSLLDAQGVSESNQNITHIIGGAFEIFSNFTLEENREFTVKVSAINDTDEFPMPSNSEMNRVMINTTVLPKDTEVMNLLLAIAKKPAFNDYLNRSFSTYFAAADASAFIFSVNNITLNNTVFNETEFTSTFIQTSEILSTLPTETIIPTALNMSSTNVQPGEEASDVWHRIRKFFRNLVAWEIVVIVAGGILLCLMMVCLCGLCARLCKRNRDHRYVNANTEYEQDNVPVVVSNKQSHYTEAHTTTQHQLDHNQYNKTYGDDDQVYV